MINEMAANAHKRSVSLGGATSSDDLFASVTGFEDFGNGEDDLDLMDGEDESKDSLGDLQDGSGGGPARKLKRPPSTAEKKATHNAVERARRESLNGRFLVLADMLPGMNHVKRASKAAIVNKSIDLINDLRATETKLSKENNSLKQELEALRSRLAAAGAGPAGPPTGMPPLPIGLQGPAGAHAAAAAAAAMMAAGHHPHQHPALAGLTGQMPPPPASMAAFQQAQAQLHQQMQDSGMLPPSQQQQQQQQSQAQQPPLTPNGVQPLSAQQMHEHAAAMTMAAHQHQFLQQQHHLAQQQAQAQAQQMQHHQQQQQQQMQQQQQNLPIFPGVFNGFFNGVGLLDTLENARSESGSPTSAHSSAQQQAIVNGPSPSSTFAYNATIPQLPAPLASTQAHAAAYFNEAALTNSSSTENNNSLHTLLGNAATNHTASPSPSHYSPNSFHSPSSSTFAQRLGSRGTISGSGSSGNEGTAPSPASSHSVPTPPNATYSPPSSTASAIVKTELEKAQAVAAPALASPLIPSFEDSATNYSNAKAQADLQQYFAYQQRLASSLNGQQSVHAQAHQQVQAQAQAAAAAAAMGFLPSHAAAAAAVNNASQSPTSATFCGAAAGQGMNIPAWQLMMAQHQALSTYGGVTGPTHF